MKAQHWQRIHDELVTACISLFRDNGVELTAADEAGGPDSIAGEGAVAFIGFTGDHLRGHLTILAPVGIVARSHPLNASITMDDDAICDWARELANQLLGRMKNRLLELGIVLLISMPSAALGEKVRGHQERQEGFRTLNFMSGSERLTVMFDARATEFAPVTLRVINAGPPPQAEGDLLLF